MFAYVDAVVSAGAELQGSDAMSDKTDRMLDVCQRYAANPPDDVMVPEPYLPYIPARWNGVLVLAEAQQLAGAETYRKWLLGLSPEQRMNRLSLANPSGVGVGPWDDGIIKLAVQAMISGRPGFRLDEVAVGNAVPWSCCTERGTNANPTPLMQQRASEFWRDLLAIWEPQFKPKFQ